MGERQHRIDWVSFWAWVGGVAGTAAIAAFACLLIYRWWLHQ